MGIWWGVALGAVVVFSLVVVLSPLLRPRSPQSRGGGAGHGSLEGLLQEKARVLRALKDLEHERSAGMVEEEDFQQARKEYLEKAAMLNRAVASEVGVPPQEDPEEGT